jgi:hypothetical protein
MSLASKVSALATRVGQEVKTLKARSIAAGTGLTGGGTLAADRTLSLSSASIASLGKADTAVQADDTRTLTNKRITPRVATLASSATPSVNTDATDMLTITALATAITSVTATGTPTGGQKLMVRIKDNGTARAIAWGASFVPGPAPLLTTTVAGKTHLAGFIYDAVAAKWVCAASDPAGY